MEDQEGWRYGRRETWRDGSEQARLEWWRRKGRVREGRLETRRDGGERGRLEALGRGVEERRK